MYSINQIVSVTSFFFTQSLRALPRSIEFGNTRHNFKDGLRYRLGQGKRAIQLFDMSDGHTTFRLRLEGDQWTLVGTKVA